MLCPIFRNFDFVEGTLVRKYSNKFGILLTYSYLCTVFQIIIIIAMNISYKWLKEYVDFDLTPQQVCDALTSTGLEVDALEEVQSIKGGLKGLYVG